MRNALEGLIGFQYNNEIYYYLKNGQRDIIGIYDSNYNKVARYEYDSWGNLISIIDSNGNDVTNKKAHIGNINPFRYRSYYYDTETKLYYLNSRYYNPQWGRFINADGFISTDTGFLRHNIYVYCNNDFVNMIDNEGLFPSWNDIVNGVKSVLDAVVNVGKEAVNTTVNICKEVGNKVSSAYNAVADAFVAEGGCGRGAGISLLAGNYDIKATYYQDVTKGIKSRKVYSNITGTAGIDILGYGGSWSYEHPYPYPSGFSYWESDKFNIRNIMRSPYLLDNGWSLDTPGMSYQDDTLFIGFGGSLHVGYGCHGKIGFEIKR